MIFDVAEATANLAMLFYLDNSSVTPNQIKSGAGPRRQRLLAELVNQQRRRDGNPMQEPQCVNLSATTTTQHK
jgi:hypothetical protein